MVNQVRREELLNLQVTQNKGEVVDHASATQQQNNLILLIYQLNCNCPEHLVGTGKIHHLPCLVRFLLAILCKYLVNHGKLS